MNRPSALARAAVGMGLTNAVSRGFGFLRVLAIAWVLGTTYLGNIFQSANSVSNVLFELVAAGALSAVLVPTFVGLFSSGDKAEVQRLAGGLLGLATLLLGALSLLGVVFAPFIARVLSASVDDPTIAAQQRELGTFLLRFFVPQVVLYAFGAVAIAVLQARRQFIVGAAAPIGNSVVMIAALIAFRVMYGSGRPGLVLESGEKLALALGGTLGVVAFVGIPTVAVWRSGINIRPRLMRRDRALRRVLELSGWAIVLHMGVGVLLAAVLVVGNGVEGGVVAYQVAFVFFLAPYAVFAQPIQTAILPELSLDATSGDMERFGRSLRSSLENTAILVLPVSAAMLALAQPIMTTLAFGHADGGDGASLLGAALGALMLGLLPYCAFMLLSRAYYALGDSRTPALLSVMSAVLGAVVMVLAAPYAHGTALVAVLGLGHSLAYTLGAGALAVGLSRRFEGPLVTWSFLEVAVVASAVGALAWFVERWLDIEGRGPTLVMMALVTAGGAALYYGALRVVGIQLLPSAHRLDEPQVLT